MVITDLLICVVLGTIKYTALEQTNTNTKYKAYQQVNCCACYQHHQQLQFRLERQYEVYQLLLKAPVVSICFVMLTCFLNLINNNKCHNTVTNGILQHTNNQ